MSFTPSNSNMGGMPDISARMVPVGGTGHYESQGVDRAVIIGQDGRPLTKVESVPPFDLLTEENRHIIEQRKRQREAEKRKKLQAANKPATPTNPQDILETVKSEIVGKSFKYITSKNFGSIVEVVGCDTNNGAIQLTMSDGYKILLEDLESQFIADIGIIDEIVEEAEIPKEPINQPRSSKPEPKPEPKPVQVVNTSSSLPNSPLRDLLAYRKKNPMPITIDVNIDLVKREFFNIIDESYDNAIDYVIEHIMNNLTIDQVKESIKEKLMLYYKSEENSVINQEFENKQIYKEPETIILEKSQ